jgi:ectoine hydroxylase-related dioxygenase (phytanoyl-CoA dioxygenase family)
MTTAAPTLRITDEQIRQFHEEGYFLLERAIPQEHLELLRRHCQFAIDETNAEMDRLGTDVLGINKRGSRYFSGHTSLRQPELFRFIHSPLMADICRATLGPEAFVFWEQYVVKMAEAGMKFSWHQDSGYVGDVAHRPYLTCWCPLDDVTEENGTVYVLPFSRAGGRALRKHHHDPLSNDLVGYEGDDPGVPIVCPAGSIAVFSSVTLHRSGANRTDGTRRVYLIQYSTEKIAGPDGKLRGRDERVLAGGELVGKPPV